MSHRAGSLTTATAQAGPIGSTPNQKPRGRPLIDSSRTQTHAPTIRRVALADIRFDHAYQRSPEAVRVERLATHWDPKLAGVIILSLRAGVLWCVDGQHRLAAMAQQGITMADASVLEGLTQQDEAALFVLYNSSSKFLGGWDRFKAELVAGVPEAIEVEAVTLASGYRLGNVPLPNYIQALGALRRVHRIGGSTLLATVLQMVRAVWQGDKRATNAPVLVGLAWFLNAYQSEPVFAYDRLAQIMENKPSTFYLRRAMEIRFERLSKGVSGYAVAEALREEYNAGLGRDRRLGTMPKFSTPGGGDR